MDKNRMTKIAICTFCTWFFAPFGLLWLATKTLETRHAAGLKRPTLIQRHAVPIVGHQEHYDLVAQAQTGEPNEWMNWSDWFHMFSLWMVMDWWHKFSDILWMFGIWYERWYPEILGSVSMVVNHPLMIGSGKTFAFVIPTNLGCNWHRREP